LTLFTPAGPENLWLYESVAVLVVFPTIIWIGAHDEPGPRMQAFFLLAGRLSYPLYILHYPFVRIFNTIAKALGPEGPVLALVLAVEIITVIVVSYGVMKLFDEPVRRRLTQAWRALRRQAPKGRPLGV
jgi:peptidoglycan/LPS O-acetylase OafA/YrhL